MRRSRQRLELKLSRERKESDEEPLNETKIVTEASGRSNGKNPADAAETILGNCQRQKKRKEKSMKTGVTKKRRVRKSG